MTVSTGLRTDPLVEMNTTPLIDVLLVLLVMLIITMPPQSHSVKLDLPNVRPPDVPIDPIKNKVVVTVDSRILWNGVPVTKPQLHQALNAMLRLPRPAELQLQPDAGARYSLVDEVLVLTKQTSVTQMGFVGNERYANF